MVSRDLPSDGVYGGVPGQRICSIEEYRQKNKKLREELMDFSKIHLWNQWSDALQEEKQNMIESMDEGIGCI